jgi:2-polyprenyl-6-methoxyphenol hydroxylase-like FAD-dependent oxidoreductase
MHPETQVKNSLSILIVGGGPVGLFLAICLNKAGIDCAIVEQKEKGITHSRALGIHPVVLRHFKKIGILDAFLDKAIRISKGQAIGHSSKLGELNFDRNKMAPLSCPQYLTEQILEEQLLALNPYAIWRKTEFISYVSTTHGLSVSLKQEGVIKEVSCDFLVGCDGKNSRVRETANISFEGKRYPDTYLMGDFEDNSGFGSDALVYLPKQGVIESFPIPNGRRRWVAKTDTYIENPSENQLKNLLKTRIQYDLQNAQNFMIGSFGVQKLTASTFYKNRVLLAGDAAHIVSPIGGQGMNLGWLDVWELSKAFEKVVSNDTNKQWEKAFEHYNRKQQKMAQKVLNRAETNMKLGRALKHTRLRDFLIRIMLVPPFNKIAKQLFTMEKLSSWPI